jgi:ferredoxin
MNLLMEGATLAPIIALCVRVCPVKAMQVYFT